MKTTHFFSLAVIFAALTLTFFLSSCGTMGDGGGSDQQSSSDSQQEVEPSSSSAPTPPPPSSAYIPPPSSSSGGNVLLGYCDYGKFAFQEDGELTGGCYPMGTASDQANCTAWGRVVTSCPKLSKSSFTLSSVGFSYGDIDMGLTYQASSLTTAIKEKIDLVAYNDASSNNIKNPCNVPAIGSSCGSPKLYSIPAKYHATLRAATIASDIKQFLEANDSITEADEIPISLGNIFSVISTDNEFYIVVITNVGTQSVSLEFYSLLSLLR